MIGAIIGDIVGSVYEFDNIKTKEFEIFDRRFRRGGGSGSASDKGHAGCFQFREEMFFTDDTVCTVAVACAILMSRRNNTDLYHEAEKYLDWFGNHFPGRGYGGSFGRWLEDDVKQPYGSWGNGAVMRVSPCGFMARSEEEAETLAYEVTRVTHNSEEAIRWAKLVAKMIFWLRTGVSKEEVKARTANIAELDFKLDDIRESYCFTESCKDTAPQAIVAFFESTDFEDAIRNAISIGGDSDTLAAVTGALAEACYGVPKEFAWATLFRLGDISESADAGFEGAVAAYKRKCKAKNVMLTALRMTADLRQFERDMA